MPSPIKRICLAAGCETVIEGGALRCTVHKRVFNQAGRVGRDKRAERRWEKIRIVVLRRDHHLCRVCNRPGNEIDHIKPRSLGGTDLLTNLQVLCARCHSVKTGREHQDRGASSVPSHIH